MRLFEVAPGGFRDVLSVLKGLADVDGRSSVIPFPVLKQNLEPFGLALGRGDEYSRKTLVAFKNEYDPKGEIIKDITDKAGIVLNTDVPTDDQSPAVQKPTGPSVDAMASSNSKQLSPNI